MNKQEHKRRVALALMVAGVIFAFMIVTVAFTGLLGYIFVRTGLVDLGDNSAFSPNKIILLMSINSLILGAIITALASRYPLKPVNKVISQMNRLASGDFKARLHFGKPFGRHPTVVEITDSFNKMAEEQENTELLRSDFINNFSHEFKTPIVSIAGFAKLLRRGNLTEEQRAEYLAIIEEESLRLSAMATNVLDMTKIENHAILTDVTRFNLSEQLRSCMLLLEGKWTRRHIEISIELGEYMISANEEMLKHVWVNLMDNAIKFSPEYGTVEVSVKEKGDTLAVSVMNTGSEIPEEQQQRIFNKFYQADESHSAEGNGIGLALVKRVVELHKGAVSVQSGNNTTVFTVELPKEQ